MSNHSGTVFTKLRDALFEPPGDARFIEIVRRHLHFHAVADGETHPSLAHFATDRGEHEVLVVQLDAEHSPRQHCLHAAFDFNMCFFHKLFVKKLVLR